MQMSEAAPVPNKQKPSKEFGRSLYDFMVWLGENPRLWINVIPWLLVVGFLALLFAGYLTVQIKGLTHLANVGSPWVHWTVDTFVVDLRRCDAAALEAKSVCRLVASWPELGRLGT